MSATCRPGRNAPTSPDARFAAARQYRTSAGPVLTRSERSFMLVPVAAMSPRAKGLSEMRTRKQRGPRRFGRVVRALMLSDVERRAMGLGVDAIGRWTVPEILSAEFI